MWCVADLDEDYISKMEDVLETYERPLNPKEPVVCLDEKPVTLHADVRPSSAAAPGREARRDNEYERRGTANVFCGVEPKAGKHFTFPTPDRSAPEFAQVLYQLALQYPEAKTIHTGHGQPEYPSPQITDRLLRAGRGQRNLGPIHYSLHAHPWKLAESGGNRNRPVFPSVPRAQTHSRSDDAPPGEPRMEPPYQSRPHQDQLEIRPQIRSSEIRLYKTLFQAVTDLVSTADCLGMGPGLGLIHPAAARVIAECDQDQDAQPDQTGDTEKPRQVCRVTDAHKDPNHKRGLDYCDQKRHNNVPFA